MHFEILGKITNIEIIAVSSGIQILPLLQKRYGKGRWRKLKGNANVCFFDGGIRIVELHWYEAHGLGRKEFKLKFPLID